MTITIDTLVKTFGTSSALNGVSLDIADGAFVALLGPSGSGKTTLLRIIAGLEAADSGHVLFGGEDVTDRPVQDRRIGFVFQHYALFRHMTVAQNIAFGLTVMKRRQRPRKADIAARVEELLALVQLPGLGGRFPSQLSGGQRQRVALARALAVEPKVLLLDEPFGALDAKVRRELRRWLRRLHDEIHITSVFVTHDQEEALEVADRIAVMNEGKIEQIGSPQEVYDKPASKFVYNFLGNVNLFKGRIAHGEVHIGDGDDTTVYVRPHDVDVSREPVAGGIAVKVDHISPIGPIVRLHLLRLDSGEQLEAEITRERYGQLKPKIGEQLHIALSNAKVFTEDYSI